MPILQWVNFKFWRSQVKRLVLVGCGDKNKSPKVSNQNSGFTQEDIEYMKEVSKAAGADHQEIDNLAEKLR